MTAMPYALRARTRYGHRLMNNPFLMLGIESSCDETAAAIVAEDGSILASEVASQMDVHAAHGGVVPEIAARAHLDAIELVIASALADAGIGIDAIGGVAATGGPGLIGGVVVGTVTAKAIATARNIPYYAVNHLEGHALSPRLVAPVAFPYLLLLVSGGHTQLLAVHGPGAYERYGTTMDDAAGEAFDKSAKIMGLGYPGGPAIERLAADGDAEKIRLPRPLKGADHCHFSFSGLKTAVLHAVGDPGALTDTRRADMAASFQAAVADVLADRASRAMRQFAQRHPTARTFVVAGGVAANQALRARLATEAAAQDFTLVVPPVRLCTDNAVMIAWAGLERLRLGQTDDFATPPRARWPLDATAAAAGAKA